MDRNQFNLDATRRSLLSRLINLNDNDSWQEFYNTYSRLIFSVALRAGLRNCEAEEVLQETVIAVSKKMPVFKYDPSRSFKAWLLHTTQWRISDQFKKRQPQLSPMADRTRTKSRTSTVERIPDPAGFLETIWDQEYEDNIIEAAMERVKRQVKAKQFQIYDLYVLKKWSVEKVASTMGVKPGAVYLAKFRIKYLVKKELKALQNKPL